MTKTSNKRSYFAISLFFISVLFVSHPVLAAPLKITFVNPGFEEQGFWKAVTDTMKASAIQLDIELDVRYGDRQWPKMVSEAEAAIAETPKPDFLILVNEHQQGARLLELANQAGIPSIMLLNTLTEEQIEQYGNPRQNLNYWLGSLTPDNEIAGYEMAQSLFEAAKINNLNKDGQIHLLTLAGDNTTPASIFRLQGLDRALTQYPELIQKRRISVNWSKDEAYNRTKLWLDSGQPLEAIWAANDPIGLGALQAVKEAGLIPGEDVMISGLNWSPEAIDHVQKGEMTLTHGGHFLAGAWIMVMLRDYAQGLDFAASSPNVRFPMTAITRKNAMNYNRYLGDQQWSRVDFSQFSLGNEANKNDYHFTLTKLLETIQP